VTGEIAVRNHGGAGLCSLLAFAWLAAPICSGALAGVPAVVPSALPRIGTVDERFQSYNIEMVEVTGGEFWKPYRSKPGTTLATPQRSEPATPGKKVANLFQYRPPIDLANARLRQLASALAPAYVRVSGTWANSTYFADSNNAPAAAPAGFNGVLTRPQWRGVIDFSLAVNAKIVTSFAISAGTRDAAGVWTSEQARRLLDYTRSIGGRVTAAEFMNEPDLAAIGGAPEGYDAEAYGRDFRIFHAFVKQAAPDLLILGPGTVGESSTAADLLAATAPGLDVISYHHYGAVSQRCAGRSGPEAALSEPWLSLTDRSLDFYKSLRDRFAPGKPIWLTETAEAACGGDPWAASFLDTFRYLNQLGRLARAGVQVVMHNTLAASDYGLLEENTLRPRPDYWGALLWRQLMGTTVLDATLPLSGLHIYAHCLRNVPGGVALLVINADRLAPHALTLPIASKRYTLDTDDLLDEQVRLNGRRLALDAGGELPPITGTPASAATLTFEPATITFLGIAEAANESCR
jgi:heparanase 1